MKIRQTIYLDDQWTEVRGSKDFDTDQCQLVLAFGSRQRLSEQHLLETVRDAYPHAQVVFGSTSGEIIENQAYDDSMTVTAVQFEKSRVATALAHIDEFSNSYEAGAALIRKLNPEGLVSALIIADGTMINGSELVAGLNALKPARTIIAGGLAGDGADFVSTLVGLNETMGKGYLVAIGLYGESLRTSSRSMGGWDAFGPERTITKSSQNVLYEIDGKNALQLYKEYLGPYADELPGSAFLFPLSLRMEGSDTVLVRTILTIDEKEQSMTFAGNLPEGGTVRLMKANFDRLIQASSDTARDSFIALGSVPELAILISCVGRKIVLQGRIEEEIEAARTVLGPAAFVTGFYSYGELSPLAGNVTCELHNQTMTITTLAEV